MSARRILRALPLVVALAGLAGTAAADWLSPDATYRDAQAQLRSATRDTVGHGDDVARLDTLATALLRLGRLNDARKLFTRVLDTAPNDAAASAALGKLALFADDLPRAESLLTRAGEVGESRADLYATLLRRGSWSAAATLATELNDEGRVPLLESLSEQGPGAPTGTPGDVWLERIWPAPLVRVKLNGTQVWMLVDTGTPGLLLDPVTVRQNGVRALAGQRLADWDGSRVAVRNALAPRLEIAGITWTNVPAGVVSLHKMSLLVNPQSVPVVGVIGLSLLRDHDVTFDFKSRRLRFAALGSTPKGIGARVPFELWGEGGLTVWGALGGGRRMAMLLATGLPEAGVGAPDVVFDELGLKPGGLSRLVKGAGSWLQGRPWAQVGVPGVTLGAVAFDSQPGWAGAMDPLELWRHGVRRDALLGPGILRGRRMTIDWTRHELVFED